MRGLNQRDIVGGSQAEHGCGKVPDFNLAADGPFVGLHLKDRFPEVVLHCLVELSVHADRLAILDAREIPGRSELNAPTEAVLGIGTQRVDQIPGAVLLVEINDPLIPSIKRDIAAEQPRVEPGRIDVGSGERIVDG